jgi:tRNA(adenine34) deaminase
MTRPTQRSVLVTLPRRHVAIAVTALLATSRVGAQVTQHPNRKWYEAAEAMRQRALGWGDQPYGAVLVTRDGLVAQGPSRVVKNSDPDAHAEREAIREAQRLVGSADLTGAVLYSTSRPCRLCEQAAASAGVVRMYFGPELTDAGSPRR